MRYVFHPSFLFPNAAQSFRPANAMQKFFVSNIVVKTSASCVTEAFIIHSMTVSSGASKAQRI
jgi:hypothetical protein